MLGNINKINGKKLIMDYGKNCVKGTTVVQ